MDSPSKAQEIFFKGYNCAQSVFAANAPRFGISETAALRIAAGMGGGVGRMREVCGAFSACAMLAGLAQNADTPEDRAAVYAFVQNMAREFKAQAGSIICREILELGDCQNFAPAPDGRTAEYYKKRPCARIVGIADAIAAKIGS